MCCVGLANAPINKGKVREVVGPSPLYLSHFGLGDPVGLAVVMPVLGHSTWHLYRKVVEPDLSPRQEQPRPPKRWRRYAAQFPAALFAGEDRP